MLPSGRQHDLGRVSSSPTLVGGSHGERTQCPPRVIILQGSPKTSLPVKPRERQSLKTPSSQAQATTHELGLARGQFAAPTLQVLSRLGPTSGTGSWHPPSSQSQTTQVTGHRHQSPGTQDERRPTQGKWGGYSHRLTTERVQSPPRAREESHARRKINLS